jgi:hypothetical protein
MQETMCIATVPIVTMRDRGAWAYSRALTTPSKGLRMRRAAPRSLSIAIATLLTCAVGASAADKPAPVLIGFDAAGSSAQRALEARFDAQLKADDQRGWLHDMASEPNHVGSPHDKANAEYTLAKFKEWGWDAQIETFDVLYPTPKSNRSSSSRRRRSRRSCTSRRSTVIPRRRISTRRCRRTTCSARTATSPPNWSTSTTACPTTTRSSRATAST